MRRFPIKATLALAIATVAAAVPPTAVAGEQYYEVNTIGTDSGSDFKPNEVIVKFKDTQTVRMRAARGGATTGMRAVDAVLARFGMAEADQLMPLTGAAAALARVRTHAGTEVEVRDMSRLYCLRAADAVDVAELVAALEALPEVEFAEPNYMVHACADASDYSSDPLYPQQWGLQAVKVDQLWAMPVLPGKKPVIAILDTGVDIGHPDLQQNIWTNQSELSGAYGLDDDGNGFVDDYHGWDFVNQSGNIDDYNGHGTHCAGIAAAAGGNGIGIVGANPDALIMPVTVMQSDGTGDVATIIRGIDYAAANGADVISMSFGGYSHSIAEEQALARAYSSAVLVAAAGNDHYCIYTGHCQMGPGPMFPAAFTFVLGVQANDRTGMAVFSNYDEDGPIYFNPEYFSEEQMYNYELSAPGTAVMSTYPGGRYKALNGTSMACPLVAGAVSRLLSAKDYASKELLFGDLIHSAGNPHVDFMAAYNIKDADRKPNLALVSWRIDDETDHDGRFDAGETVNFYPTIRNDWGTAQNIRVWMEVGELEGKVVEFERTAADFSKPLSSYAKAESENPIRFKVADEVVDGRRIRLTINAQCDGMDAPMSQEITITAQNGIEIGGMVESDTTLEPGVNYIVTRQLLVCDNATLTIKPGCVLSFANNAGITTTSQGKVVAIGEPDNMITFTSSNLSTLNTITLTNENSSYVPRPSNQSYGLGTYHFDYSPFTCEYVRFDFLELELRHIFAKHCLIENSRVNLCYNIWSHCTLMDNADLECSGFDYDNSYGLDNLFVENTIISNNQLRKVKNPALFKKFKLTNLTLGVESLYMLNGNNIIHPQLNGNIYSEGWVGEIYTFPHPSYYGTADISKVKSRIEDIDNPTTPSATWRYDLSNMLLRPNPEAHGVVWKVVVDGYDAQDEFDMLPPLGVGRHKFEVYYSKVIDHSEAPTIAMGVRPPYTQTSIAADGSWRTETLPFDNNGTVTDVPVSVYTAYLDITGKMAIDGLNRIYVNGGRDLEYFPIPREDMRFNVEVAAAGSMSTGFYGEAGLGKVTLTWEEQDDAVDDILGYNLYRMADRETTENVYDSELDQWIDRPVTVTDTIRINERLLDQTGYTDFDVVPGKTYSYYYKIMRTSMTENSPSRVVAVTPLTAAKGDANGSMSVDIADVVTEVSYMLAQNPQPFIFEAADVNSDSDINILDVVGTLNIIMQPATAGVQTAGSASYWLEDGVLYVESDVALAGVQFTFDGVTDGAAVHVLDALAGMEVAGAAVDGSYMFMAYSMVGRTLAPGRHALVSVAGATTLSGVTFSDAQGHNVAATEKGSSGLDEAGVAGAGTAPWPNPFGESVNIPYTMPLDGSHRVSLLFSDMSGRRIDAFTAMGVTRGEYVYTWRPAVQPGVYFATLWIDGQPTGITYRLIKK